MEYAEIGKRVRLAREEAGLSQEELGKLLNCSGVTISTWETGKRRISLEDLHSLARVLGKPLAFFFPDESLSLNVEYQIGTLLHRSIGDFLGTRQIPVYAIKPSGGSAAPRFHLARYLSVETQSGAEYGLIVPDNRLATIGIAAGDIAVCRGCDGVPPQADGLLIFPEGDSFKILAVTAGERVVCPDEVICPMRSGGPLPPGGSWPASSRPGQAPCGYLVFVIKHVADILPALSAGAEKS